MVETNSKGLWSRPLGTTLGKLRSRGRDTLRAALAPPPRPEPAKLPSLQGEALARHHLSLAIDALRTPGKSKPQTFRELRLLINRFEQATGRPALNPMPAETSAQLLPMSRRARLLNRAFESASTVAAWRARVVPSQEQAPL